jgi:hypothetical protein
MWQQFGRHEANGVRRLILGAQLQQVGPAIDQRPRQSRASAMDGTRSTTNRGRGSGH